jgi:hypothetical protein
MLFICREDSAMKSKIFPALKTLILVFGAVSLQACFYGGHRYEPAPYAYEPPPRYVYAPPPPVVVYGDYDEHHAWHDRDWWVRNNHPWVEHHHPDWVASREHGHDRDHDHR